MRSTMYYNKVKACLKGLQEEWSREVEGEVVEEERKHREEMGRLYKALSLWLEEAKVLDSTLYIPALAPSYLPRRLAALLAGETGLWLELVRRHTSVVLLNLLSHAS